MSRDFQARLRALTDRRTPDKRTQTDADIEEIIAAGAASYAALSGLATDPHARPNLSTTAAWALGQLADRRAAEALLTVVSGAHGPALLEAAKWLGNLRRKRTALPLVAIMLMAEDHEQRAAAAYALGWIGDKRAIDPLERVLSNEAEAPTVRGQAAEALAYLNARESVGTLMAGLGDPAAEVRFWCAFALGHLGDNSALPALHRLATSDGEVALGWWTVSREAKEAIEHIKARTAES